MPTYFARKSGNINASDVWATTPTGAAGNFFPSFTTADVLVANNFNITINADTIVGTVRGDTFGGATNGGQFLLNSGRTLSANVTAGVNYCVGFNQSGSATIVGNVSNSGAISNGSGNLIIIGNVSGTSNTGARTDSSTATLSITGNVTGGSQMGVLCQLGTVNIQGNVTGSTTNTSMYGVHNATTGTVNVTGIVTGGNATSAFGIRNDSTGIVNVNGIVIGGSGLSATSGVSNASTGNVFVKRAVGNGFGPGSTGVAAAVGLTNSGAGFVSVEEIEFGVLGMSPVSGGGIRLKKLSSNVAVFNYVDSGAAKTLIDATQANQPAITDVRSGVSYASGTLTGTCAVPAAGSVALGVPVDATTGTAALTPEAVWNYASRIVTGGTVDTLTNAPTVPSASAIASQVRTELGTELSRIDQAISTRATPANIPSADITAIKTKTDALNTTRLAQVSTTEIVGSLLAQANS